MYNFFTNIKKDFFYILGSNIVNKIIGLIGSILIVRLIDKQEYGIFAAADNIISLFMIFTGMGITAGILQFNSECRYEEEKNSLYKFGIIFGVSVNILLSIFILITIWLGALDNNHKLYVQYLMLFPVFFIVFDYGSIILRTKKENKKYAKLMNFNSVMMMIFSVYGSYCFGVAGLIIARYTSLAFSILYLVFLIKKHIKDIVCSQKLDCKIRKKLLSYSITCCGCNSIAAFLLLFDLFCLNTIVHEAGQVAAYKVATVLPMALMFIPTSIVIFIYPYFAEKKNDLIWIRKNTIKLIKTLLLFYFVISGFVIIFAPEIVLNIWGNSYSDAVLILRILTVGSFFTCTFRTILGNVFAMMNLVRINFFIGIATCMLSVISNVVLIKMWEIKGAAVSNLLISIFASIIYVWYFFYFTRVDLKK